MWLILLGIVFCYIICTNTIANRFLILVHNFAASRSEEGIANSPCIPQGYDHTSNASDAIPLASHPVGNFSACKLEVMSSLKMRRGTVFDFRNTFFEQWNSVYTGGNWKEKKHVYEGNLAIIDNSIKRKQHNTVSMHYLCFYLHLVNYIELCKDNILFLTKDLKLPREYSVDEDNLDSNKWTVMIQEQVELNWASLDWPWLKRVCKPKSNLVFLVVLWPKCSGKN